jgi:transposase
MKVKRVFPKNEYFKIMGNTKKPTPENYIRAVAAKTFVARPDGFSRSSKVLIVMEALRAEISAAELCRKHQINESQFYKWIGAPKR